MMADRYWLDELDKQIKTISISLKLLSWHREFFQHQMNKAVLLSAVALRNSIDSSRAGLDSLSDDHKIRQEYERVKNYPIHVMVFSKNNNGDLFSELIDPDDWDKGAWTRMSARDVTNRIVHSCSWQWVNTNKGENTGFLCTSHLKQDKLIFVPLKEWVAYIQEGKKYSKI